MSEQPRRRRGQQNVETNEVTVEAVVETANESPSEPGIETTQKMQHQEVSAQSKVCTRGRNGKNAVRKKKGKRLLFASILLGLIIIVGVVGIFGSINGAKHKLTQTDISAINVAHGGRVAVLEDKVYYIEDFQTVWESDLEFTKGKRAFSDKYVYLICADKNAIYYSTHKSSETPQWAIHKFDFSTKQNTQLITMKDEPKLLSCSNNQLLYIRSKALYAFDINAQSEKKIVSDAIETFTCASDGIYYAILHPNSGSIYRMKSIDAEPEFVCDLPYVLYTEESIDQLFVIDGKIFVRKRFDLQKGGSVFTSTSYQIDTKKNKDKVLITTTEDIHAQIPSPDGKGCYYILALNEEDKKTEFQRYFSNKDSDSTYLASFSSGRLAFSPSDSDWIDEVTSDYRYYYCSCYYSNEGLITYPCYSERYAFYKFQQSRANE